MHRQNRPARAAWLLGALPAVALLAACSAGPGPLGGGGSDGIQCMSFPQGKPVTTGLYDLANAGKTAVTIQHIELPADSGLTMGKTWLVPIYHDPENGNFVVVGVGAPYPPTTAPKVAEPQVAAMIGANHQPARPGSQSGVSPDPDHREGGKVTRPHGYLRRRRVGLLRQGEDIADCGGELHQRALKLLRRRTAAVLAGRGRPGPC